LAPHAKASLIEPADFTLTNSTFADGSALSPDSGLSLVITGPNDGSGEPGTTDLLAVALGTGVLQFDYAFATLDDPGYESAGYLLNGSYYLLADTDGESGSLTVSLVAGDAFGFELDSVDNTGGAGILTISDFSSPTLAPAAGVPEPGCFWLTLIAVAFGAAVKLPLAVETSCFTPGRALGWLPQRRWLWHCRWRLNPRFNTLA
jgi:hypothetical protein